MRSRQFYTLLTSVVMAIGLVGFVPSSASASPAGSFGADRTSATAQEAGSARNVTIRLSNKGRGFRLVGKVVPGGRKVRVNLFHAACTSGCPVHRVRHVKTNRKGRYSFRGLHKVGYYVATVPVSRGFGFSYSRVISVVRR